MVDKTDNTTTETTDATAPVQQVVEPVVVSSSLVNNPVQSRFDRVIDVNPKVGGWKPK